MRVKHVTFVHKLLIVAIAIVVAGCGAENNPFVPRGPSPADTAREEGTMLSAAGFMQLPANTVVRQAKMASLVAMQVQYHVGPSGKLHYWMADPYFCNCLYRGSEENFQQYEKFKMQEHFNAQEERTTHEAYEASMQEQVDMSMDEFNPYAVGMGPMWGY